VQAAFSFNIFLWENPEIPGDPIDGFKKDNLSDGKYKERRKKIIKNKYNDLVKKGE